MEQNTNENKGKAKRIINGKVHYYDYRHVIMKGEIYEELKRQAHHKHLSIAKYIKFLIERER